MHPSAVSCRWPILFNVPGTDTLLAVVFSTFSFALVTVYFFPYIIVTGNFNISNATYLANATTIAAPVFQLILGTVISWTQRAKWLFVFTNAMGLLAVGIQYAFYDPKSQLSGLVVAQIINGVSSGGIMNAMAMVQAAFGDECRLHLILVFIPPETPD